MFFSDESLFDEAIEMPFNALLTLPTFIKFRRAALTEGICGKCFKVNPTSFFHHQKELTDGEFSIIIRRCEITGL
ncbi:hypothetical protein CP556_20295 [Natrinema sp. CBA1119]|nr:hypothetical protein CP556_20295 [Natrinema sp. CBA1119]